MTKLLARWVQERSFTTTSFREPISLSDEKNGQCTEASYSYTATEGTFKDSSCTLNIVQASVTGYKDVSVVGERTLARQPVSTAIEANLCSFQLHMSGVLCSRGIVLSVEVKLVRTSAAKSAENEGECRTLTSQSPSTLTSCLQSSCTPVHLQPTVILMTDGFGSRPTLKTSRVTVDRRETGKFYTEVPTRLPHDFLLKLFSEKSIFLGRLGGYPIGPSLFFSSIFSFFHFRFLFQFLSMLFLFFLCFPFFHFLFLYFPFAPPFNKKCFFLFDFVSLFSFLGCSKSVAALRIPWGKVHILSWLYLLCSSSSSLFPVE